jgi:hypothetical protein
MAKTKTYEAKYLGVILVAILLIEAGLFNINSNSTLQKGFAVLDLSQTVSETSQNLSFAFQPMTDAIDSINQFYQAASTQMIGLLDMSGSMNDVADVYNGVNDFYQSASTQMAELLDFSRSSPWSGNIAGASINIKY